MQVVLVYKKIYLRTMHNLRLLRVGMNPLFGWMNHGIAYKRCWTRSPECIHQALLHSHVCMHMTVA
jgi:hypothetical protein